MGQGTQSRAIILEMKNKCEHGEKGIVACYQVAKQVGTYQASLWAECRPVMRLAGYLVCGSNCRGSLPGTGFKDMAQPGGDMIAQGGGGTGTAAAPTMAAEGSALSVAVGVPAYAPARSPPMGLPGAAVFGRRR